MTTNEKTSGESWIDPDDAPHLTREWFEGADVYRAGNLVRRGRGRPKLDRPKQQVSLRLDPDVIELWKSSGPGWQSRINDALREMAPRTGAISQTGDAAGFVRLMRDGDRY